MLDYPSHERGRMAARTAVFSDRNNKLGANNAPSAVCVSQSTRRVNDWERTTQDYYFALHDREQKMPIDLWLGKKERPIYAGSWVNGWIPLRWSTHPAAPPLNDTQATVRLLGS
jgi:hypothetical protein